MFLECMIDYCGYGRLLNHPEKVFYLRKVETTPPPCGEVDSGLQVRETGSPAQRSVQKSGAYCCSTLPRKQFG